MLRTQIAAAIGCARGHALDEIMREVWTRHGAGQLNEAEAEQLSALAYARRAALQRSGQAALGLVMPPPAERERTPVRRQSHFKGRSEGRIWRPTTRQETQKVLLAAKRYELAERQKGKRSGPLGAVAIEVLEYFVNLVDFRTGRLDPSLDTIMGKVRRSRDAVVRALKALRAHGFLDWLRRYEPTGNESGPQVQQASNAYRLSLPERALRFLERFGKAPPPPDDHVQAEAERKAVMEAHRASLDVGERVMFDVGDNALGQALARLGKSLQKRESAKQTESPPSSILYGKT
ncbi:hypothetical protein [Pseudorhizobium banfieldiae]|nr:hypothetical protein [Pseudorhizobium banfieldiae]CAD6631703.1 replication protein A [arsenite-oxidising bacterium NT-25]